MSENSIDPTYGGTPATSTDPFAAAKATALKAAEDLRTAATAKAQEFRTAAEHKAQQFKHTAEEATQHAREYADKAWEETRARTKDLATEAENFAREKPLQALLAAFGVGFLVGVMLKR